jgi:hypothetical protein
LGEKDGSLRFFSEKLNDVEQERAQVPLRSADVQRIFNTVLTEVFTPLPSARLNGSFTVTSGVKRSAGGRTMVLAGEREAIQTVVVLVDPGDYDAERTRLLDESRHRSSESTIFLLGRMPQEAMDIAGEIYRCNRIVELYRNDPDQEVKEYCAGQTDHAKRLANRLEEILGRGMARGSFVFRGAGSAVESIDPQLGSACKKHLADVAGQVYDRYTEAPERVETALPEKFLRAAASSLRAVTSQLDPLGLVQVSGGTPSIKTDYKALVSIRDHIDRNGMVEGKRLLDAFSDQPFGWSQDTTRYLISALLLAGEIKLKVGGREVTVIGQHALDALKTNNSFKSVGVSLRHDRPSMDVLARAAQRLTELSGDAVVPLEDEISRAAQKLLPDLQHRLAPLGEKLMSLALPGVDTMDSVNQQIADLLLSDASDAPQVFGAEQSTLYDELKWAQKVRFAFSNELDRTVRRLRELERDIAGLPATGAPGELRAAVRDDLERASDRMGQQNFFDHVADLNTRCTAIETQVAATVRRMAKAQADLLGEAEADFARMPEWSEFTVEEQRNVLSELQDLSVEANEDIFGLKRLIAVQFDIATTVGDFKRRIAEKARERRKRPEYKPGAGNIGDPRPRQTLRIPARISTTDELDALIIRLQALRLDAPYCEFDLEIGQD